MLNSVLILYLDQSCLVDMQSSDHFPLSICIDIRAGTNTPSDEYDSYREYRVANTNMYSRIQ